MREMSEEDEGLFEAASTLVTNAVLIPDPRMDGATDCYAVTLDDYDALRAVLENERHRVEIANLRHEMHLCSLGDRPSSISAAKLRRLIQLEMNSE